MYKLQMDNRMLPFLFFFSVALILFSSLVMVFPNHATAAGKFTINPKINNKKIK